MAKFGKNRDWGFASYNVGEDREDYDDYEMTVGDGGEEDEDQPQDDDPQIIYTSFENNGKVNQYGDNGDGGHSHYYWEHEEDYQNDKSPDQSRDESNDKPNPDDDEVNGMIKDKSCYLTTACMHHYKNNFDDNCHELKTLRWFRDKFCTEEQKKRYYAIAPKIIEEINKRSNKNEFYEYMYNKLIQKSVKAIEDGQYDVAMQIYTSHVKALENIYLSKEKPNVNKDEEEPGM